jgi:hypothetical protein
LNYRDLGYDSSGIKKFIASRRQSPGETRHKSMPDTVHASDLFIGKDNAVIKGDKEGLYSGNAKFSLAPFSVDPEGNLIATTATITGYAQAFVSTLVWTATDEDTATWASGSILTSKGTTYAISGGNTGNISSLTYVYLDPATSITVLQTSTTASDASGNNKLLLATVQEGAASSKCIIDVVGSHGTTIDGDRIITGKILSSDGKTYFDLDGDEFKMDDGAGGTVTIDPNGLAIVGGIVSIKSDDATTIIDSSGLVSTNNFDSAQVVINTTKTTTSNSFEDVSGGALTAVTLARSRRILMFLNVYGRYDGFHDDQGYLETRIYDTFTSDSTGINLITRGEYFAEVNWDAGTGLVTDSHVWGAAQAQANWGIITAAAGSHTYKMQFKVDGGDDGNIYNANIGYVILGD